MELNLLARLDTELYTSEEPSVRRRLVAQASYQDIVICLALLPEAGPAPAELAATAVLRLKGLQAEEEAFLARIMRRGQDPRVRELASEIAKLRSQLAAVAPRGQLLQRFLSEPAAVSRTEADNNQVATLAAQLQAQEFALGQISRAYAQQLQVRSFNPADLRAVLAGLPKRAALLEIRLYRAIDFRTGIGFQLLRWAGLLLSADKVHAVDLGPVAGTAAAAQALLADAESATGRQAARDLYERLLGPVAAEIAGLERLYIAPDGDLYLVPFAALRGPDGRRLAEWLDLRQLQTGRDLCRDPDGGQSARGLLALGGIDFEAASPSLLAIDPAAGPVPGGISTAALQRRTAEALGHGFAPLPGTAEEVQAIAALYRQHHRNEPVEVWEGSNASEARLKALPRPPRVLHLATHGFYLASGASLNGSVLQDRPMLLSGIALAGANRALREAGRDGILYALEAQDLNLEGTELVVLSACETAQGTIDYGEGVSGLVRALRTAGARHVLVTLRPVTDEGAADFMQRFYRHWLGQARSDPAAAFRATQVEVLAAAPSASAARRDQTWAQFVLVGP
jgi:CHAT domain-containing protein